jgi:hypothetical protein
MDGCGGSVPISLRGGFPYAAASNFAVCRSIRLRCDSRLRLAGNVIATQEHAGELEQSKSKPKTKGRQWASP